ncbi:MAG: Isoleucine-tRNA ligase, partial [Candidatus Nomurabacteria bacterium GW2011_GWB1_37_5]
KESVHLTNCPSFFGVTEENNLLLEKMETVRKIVSLGLEARQKAGIKVRQPLASLKVSAKGGSASGGKSFLKLSSEYFDLIKDEVNVKEVEFTAGKRPDLKEAPVLSKSGAIGYKTQSSEVVVPRSGLEEAVVELDTVITQELKEEGQYRELLRTIQDLRKNEGLQPNDKIGVTIDTDEIGKNLIQKFESDLKKTAGIINIDFTLNDGSEVVIDGLNFKIKIQ